MRNAPAVLILNQNVVESCFLCGIYVVKPNFGFQASPGRSPSINLTIPLFVNSFLNVKSPEFPKKFGTFGAARQIRTADLILTKDALYLLSYSSRWRRGRDSNPRPPA